jgi:predicted ester cyclase
MTPKELVIEAMRRTDAGDHDGFLELQAPDTHWVSPSGEAHGREGARESLEPFWQGFSDYRHEFSRIVESGDVAIAEGTWTGLNDGPLITPQGELPPTGRSVTFRFALVVEADAAGEQMRSVSLYFDQLEFLMQLGLVPEPEPEGVETT